MPSPLDFSLAGLTPEQLKAQQDFQRTLQPGGARAASVIPSAAGETTAEATARRAAGTTGPRPSFTSGARLQPINPVAPVAVPATAATLGQRAVAAVRSTPSSLAKLGAVAGGVVGAAGSINDIGSGYRDQSQRDLGAETTIGSVAADAFRTLSNVGDAATFGLAGRLGRGIAAIGGPGFGTGFLSESPRDKFYREQAERTTPPAPPEAGATPLVPVPSATPGVTPVQVERGRNGIPSFTAGDAAIPGAVQYTGGAAAALKGGSFNTIPAANFVQPSSAISAELSAARRAAADRGDFGALAASYGGDFGGATKQSPADKLRSQLENLPPIRTQGDLARYQAISGALAAIGGQESTAQLGAQKAAEASAQAAFDQAIGVAELGIKKQTADAATTTAASRGQSKPQIIQGLPGEAPLIVDPTTGRATRATMVPDFAEFDTKMREDKRNTALTPEEMRAIYTQQFGQ